MRDPAAKMKKIKAKGGKRSASVGCGGPCREVCVWQGGRWREKEKEGEKRERKEGEGEKLLNSSPRAHDASGGQR